MSDLLAESGLQSGGTRNGLLDSFLNQKTFRYSIKLFFTCNSGPLLCNNTEDKNKKKFFESEHKSKM